MTIVPDKPFRADSASKSGWLEKLAWSPSGNALAFGIAYDAQPAEILLVEGFGDKLVTAKLERPKVEGVTMQVKGYGSPVAWRADGELCFLVDDRARCRAEAPTRGRTGGQAAPERQPGWREGRQVAD